MLVGYQFVDSASKKTPYDYITDEETGLRPDALQPPNGFIRSDLSRGDLEYKVLPPLAIWKMGRFWDELSDEEKREVSVWKGSQWASYVTSGEGTPGNYKYRVYELPKAIGSQPEPKHPKLWTKEEIGVGFRDSFWGGKSDLPTSKVSTAKIPFGLRIRCPGCGHWFKNDDLAGHTTSCCPAVQGDDVDWVIECACGDCMSLDDTAKTKPGFPRKSKLAQNGEEKAGDAQVEETPVEAG